MLDELAPDDRVEYAASGRLGVVLAVKLRWRVPAAKVRFDGSRHPNWVPQAMLRRIDQGAGHAS